MACCKGEVKADAKDAAKEAMACCAGDMKAMDATEDMKGMDCCKDGKCAMGEKAKADENKADDKAGRRRVLRQEVLGFAAWTRRVGGGGVGPYLSPFTLYGSLLRSGLTTGRE